MNNKNNVVERKQIMENKTSCCFLCISTSSFHTDLDERKDEQRYNEYKQDNPKNGFAIWRNMKKGIKKIFNAGVEEETSLLIDDGALGSLEEDLKDALTFLHSEVAKKKGCNIKKGYDYAWIKLCIDKSNFSWKGWMNNTMPGFVDLIHRLGFNDICKEETLNKYYRSASGEGPNWVFSDNKGRTHAERVRRNDISRAFSQQMQELRGK